MKILIKKIYWWLYIVWLSLKWIPELNLGDQIWLGNKKYTLIQGVCRPLWNLMDENSKIFEYVHEDRFKKVKSFSNYLGSFKFGYWFFMKNWYAIWVNEGILPWMLECKIWK